MKKIEFKNLPDTTTPLNAENLNTMQDNIEEAIATKIGKVPQGYAGDLNDLNETCIVYAGGDATNKPNTSYAYYIVTIRRDSNYAIQIAKQLYPNSSNFVSYERQLYNGTWTEWKLISNPNITTGTEYETGRIIDGKKEYAKRIDCGAMPNAAEKRVSHGITNVYQYTKIEGIAKYGDTILPLPYIDVATPSRSIGIYLPNATQIYMYSGYNWSSFTGYVTIYYTKN